MQSENLIPQLTEEDCRSTGTNKNDRMRLLQKLKFFFGVVILFAGVSALFAALYNVLAKKTGPLIEESPPLFDYPSDHVYNSTAVVPTMENGLLPSFLTKNVFPNHNEVEFQRLQERNATPKPIVIIHDLSKEHNINSPGLSPFSTCPSLCYLSTDIGLIDQANVVLFSNGQEDRLPMFRLSTAFVYMHMESPANLRTIPSSEYANYIGSYRIGADFYAPYGVYQPFKHVQPIKADVHSKKTGSTVVWIVSNCYTQNNRAAYVDRLSRHTSVDTYGDCNSRPIGKEQARRILQKAFFYLAFENSNCEAYITEKFWINALQNRVIPVVMGAPKKDYLDVAPPNSFIHVDDFASPKELARYLYMVKQNKTLYNSYFKWHSMGKVGPSNVLCDICKYFSENSEVRIDSTIGKWLDPVGQCEEAKGPLTIPIRGQRNISKVFLRKETRIVPLNAPLLASREKRDITSSFNAHVIKFTLVAHLLLLMFN